MMHIIVHPSEKLSPYAKNHGEKFSFGMRNNPIPPPQETIISIHKSNWLTKLVYKIDGGQSLIQKISGLAFRIFLLLSVFGIPLLFFINSTHKKIKKDQERINTAQKALNLQNQIFNKRAELLENLNLQSLVDIPFVVSQNPLLISKKQLTKPISKGVDGNQCPFLALKIHDCVLGKTYILILSQVSREKQDWFWKIDDQFYPRLKGCFINDSIKTAGLAFLRSLVLNQHARFRLYRA